MVDTVVPVIATSATAPVTAALANAPVVDAPVISTSVQLSVPVSESLPARLRRLNAIVKNEVTPEEGPKVTAPSSVARARAIVRALEALVLEGSPDTELIAAATEMIEMWKLVLVDF